MQTLADLARHLNLGARNRRLPPLALLTDALRLPDPMPVAARLPVGSLVMLRHYGAADRLRIGQQLATLCRARRLRLLVAGDFALALKLGAGLHLPEGMAVAPGPRLRLWHRRRKRLLTAAAHSRTALARAAAIGSDAALVSPVFPTASHPGAAALGTLSFRQLVRGTSLPVYALGGINGSSVRRLDGSNAVGVATIGGLS